MEPKNFRNPKSVVTSIDSCFGQFLFGVCWRFYPILKSKQIARVHRATTSLNTSFRPEMDADERRRFLRERLKALVEADSLETIVEYLLSFNVSSIDTQKEIVCFLEDHVSKGFRHTVKSIVADYLGANTNAKSTRKSDVRKSSCLVIASSKKTGKKGASSSVDGASEASKCGCMATRHKYSSSCTACGRIVCEEENSGVCFFCETPILPPMSADEAADYGFDTSTLAAYRQKVPFDKFTSELFYTLMAVYNAKRINSSSLIEKTPRELKFMMLR